MDCKDCQNYKPVWTPRQTPPGQENFPPVARYKPDTPLPDGAVCVEHFDSSGCHQDWYWERHGQSLGVCDDGYVGAPINLRSVHPAIRALGLPVYGVDINCGGETTEEFWTDAECWTRNVKDELGWMVGEQPCLPSFHDLPRLQPRRVTLLRRYHGTRKDGVSVDGWIVKPVAVEKPTAHTAGAVEPPKPAPGQPCPSCGQPVPEPIPPAPFKVGDWVRLGGRVDVAHVVDDVRYESGSRERNGSWIVRAAGCWWPVRDCLSLRPALPPLADDVKEWACATLMDAKLVHRLHLAAAKFIAACYPHEFGVR